MTVLLIMTWAAGASTDPFYEQRLRAGKAALVAQRNSDAADELRIAAFGLLDEPKRLSEALALLALAQNNLGWTQQVETTLNRFVEVESRFAAWDPNALEPAPRTQFESLLLRGVPKQTLASAKSLVYLVQPAASRAADPLDVASRLIAERRPADAVRFLSDAIAREPGRRPLRLLLLQAATTSANWNIAAAQVAALKPFGETESVSMFYGAVAMFETGRLPEARDLLNKSLPRLTRSAYVDQYVKKINGG